MQYPVFVDKKEEELAEKIGHICAFCLCFCDNPILLSSCGHMYCRACIEKCNQSPLVCITCTKISYGFEYVDQSVRMQRRIFSFKCPSCTYQSTFDDVHDHIPTCGKKKKRKIEEKTDGSEPIVKRKRRDPKLPKGKRSAYIYYKMDFNTSHSTLSKEEKQVKVKTSWATMSKIDKSKWFDLAKLDKIRYDKEMKEHESRPSLPT